MSDQWGTREQPSRRDQPRYEYAWLAVCIAAITTSVAALIIEDQTSIVVFRGTYSVLAGLFVLGGCGWLQRSRETRIMRHNRECAEQLTAQLADLAGAVAALRSQVEGQRWADLPGVRAPNRWPRPVAMAVGSDLHRCEPRVGLDPETIAAARTLARVIIDGRADGAPAGRDTE